MGGFDAGDMADQAAKAFRDGLRLETKQEEAARLHQVGGDHYSSKTVQPWDAMEAWMTAEQFTGYLRGNCLKYIARCDDKGGIEDLRKAQHYLSKLIEFTTTKEQ